jgi:ribosomal protein S18 acetylase RimI-like enzyme
MRIRPVEREEWEALRALRLKALLDSPDAFSALHKDEASRPAREWQRWISGEGGRQPGKAITFVADDEGFHGMATGAVFDAEPKRGHLFGMWIRPAARGRGLGMQLLDAVAAWARDHGVRELELRVSEGNSPAARLYDRAGFISTGERSPLRDGSELMCVVMVRHLD